LAPRLGKWVLVKIFVLGKFGHVTHWLEDAVAAFRAEGHEVRVGATRDPRLNAHIEALAWAPWLGAPLASRLLRSIKAFSPDLVLAIAASEIPPSIIEQVGALRGRPLFVGWVGDVFGEEMRRAAAALDAIAYTDSGLVDVHRRLGFPGSPIYLPHGANPHIAPGAPASARQGKMAFVGHPSPHRLSVLAALRSPISLYGETWGPFPRIDHEVHRGRVSARELVAIYAAHRAALNIRNEAHVIHGLNQRNFDPYLTWTPVIAEDQRDLAGCFDVGTEVLVWRDIDELNEVHERIQRAPEAAAEVARLGRRRVLIDHTYGRRLEALAKLL
jgi:spore maturation protein CgeB